MQLDKVIFWPGMTGDGAGATRTGPPTRGEPGAARSGGRYTCQRPSVSWQKPSEASSAKILDA